MTETRVRAELSSVPLDVAGSIADIGDDACGGTAVFIGTVRASSTSGDHTSGRVVALDYEAHPQLAEPALRSAAERAASRWDVKNIVVVHRTGRCELGDPTVVVVCGAPHRGDALEACRWLIDELKATVPIWKKEIFEDGSSWVGAEGVEAIS